MQLETDYISLTIYKQRQTELIKQAEHQRLVKTTMDANKKKSQDSAKGQTR